MPPDDEFRPRTHPIRENMRFQQRVWRLERAVWIGLVAIAAMAAFGLFSNGALSQHTVSNGPLAVEYQRFERNGASSRMTIRLESTRQPSVSIEGDLLENFVIESLYPEPVDTRSRGTGIDMTFVPDETGFLQLQLSIRPDAVGLSKSRISDANGHTVSLSQLIYP